MLSQKDIGEESIRVTFGNGTTGEYFLATVKVKFDGEEYDVKAAVVKDLAEEVLLGRDVPLHRHVMKRLPKKEQVELLRQLAKSNNIYILEDTALAVVTQVRKKKLDQRSNNRTQDDTEGKKTHQDEEEKSGEKRILDNEEETGSVWMQDEDRRQCQH